MATDAPPVVTPPRRRAGEGQAGDVGEDEEEVHLPKAMFDTEWSPKTMSFIGDLTSAQASASETVGLLLLLDERTPSTRGPT